MYTQCPDCREAFHVTAEILQQAGGRVRCGACGHTFDALDGLSEAPPPYTGAPDDDEESAFRNVLEELGDTDNVRLEDTGVEWRLVEEEDTHDDEAESGDDSTGASALRWFIRDDPDEPENDPVIPEARVRARQEPLELETPTEAPAAPEERYEERYDDHTPIAGLLDDDDEIVPAIAETPRRRAEDFIEPRSPEFDERQVDLALGEPEEWTDLLREVGDGDDAGPAGAAEARPGAGTGAAPEASHAPEADEDPTAEHPVLDAGELTLVEEDAPAAPRGWTPAAESEEQLELVDELTGAADEDGARATGELERRAAPPEPGGQPSSGRGANPSRAVPPTEEEMTIDRLIDEDLLRLTGEQDALDAPRPGPAVPQHVETIVMEGEFVQSSLSGEIAASEPAGERPLGDAGALKDSYIRVRDATDTEGETRGAARYPGLAAAVMLVLLLAGQLVHAYRETLATWPVFDGTVGAVYRRLGAPITPGWDVNGWQIRSTTGSTDASGAALTISSRIANRSERALPYPLLHVTLTDRYEEVVGSTLLAPEQYLAIRSARGMVDPGEHFNATVTIAPLAAAAEGFKLNVCYAMVDDDVRCAKGAFKRN